MQTPHITNIAQFLAAIPKVELHLHLEGAIPLSTLFRYIQRQNGNSAITTLEDLRQRFTYTDFSHFIELWKWKDTFITHERDFAEITYQVLTALHAQNVRYVEAFYAPGGYRQQGLSVRGITEQILAGKARAARDFGIQCAFIIDVIRGDGLERGMSHIEEVTPYLGDGVIGIGLGGPEKEFPAELYTEIYQEAKRRGFRLTAHAGEADGAHSIRAAIEQLGAERIGHGLRAYEDPELLALLKARQIPLEMCVLSNVRTGVCPSVEAHPIKAYYQQGLMVTVNSDDPAMFNTSLTQEYQVLVQQLGFTLNDVKQVSLNGITASFLAEDEKRSMRTQFEQEWRQLLTQYGAANIRL